MYFKGIYFKREERLYSYYRGLLFCTPYISQYQFGNLYSLSCECEVSSDVLVVIHHCNFTITTNLFTFIYFFYTMEVLHSPTKLFWNYLKDVLFFLSYSDFNSLVSSTIICYNLCCLLSILSELILRFHWRVLRLIYFILHLLYFFINFLYPPFTLSGYMENKLRILLRVHYLLFVITVYYRFLKDLITFCT